MLHRPSALDKVTMFAVPPQNSIPQGEALKTMCQIFSLDGGEIEALAIMEKNPNAILFTDQSTLFIRPALLEEIKIKSRMSFKCN